MDYNARFYDPMLGRFTSPDSIVPDPGSVIGYNRFAYVNNNPIKDTDSTGSCIDGLTTIPCLMALIAVTGFAGGAAVHEFNEIGHSWWESPEYTESTFRAGMDGFALSVSVALTAMTGASMAPDLAMWTGSKTNNVSLYSWGATQNGFLPANSTPNDSYYTKVEFQGRTVYQDPDIDWDYVDPDSGLTNRELASKGLSPFYGNQDKYNLHHLLQQEPGPMVEVPSSLHIQYYKDLHGLIEDGESFRNDPVLVNQYNTFRKSYWKWRAAALSKIIE